MSDLELAWKVASEKAGSPFNKGDLNVVPMPSRTFKSGQGIYVYYEIYNLAKDAFGQTNYTISHTITSSDLPGTLSATSLACSAGGPGYARNWPSPTNSTERRRRRWNTLNWTSPNRLRADTR